MAGSSKKPKNLKLHKSIEIEGLELNRNQRSDKETKKNTENAPRISKNRDRFRPRYKTHGFNNTRFFTSHSRGGREDWWTIVVKGRREWLTAIDPERCALVIVDMQRGSLNWSGLPGELGKTYQKRMQETVIPNISRLVHFFRQKEIMIVYLSLKKDEILPEIAPSKEEIKEKREFLLTKYSSGAFVTCAIDNVLRENGIATLFFVGTDTAGCVAATMDEAYDRSYQTILIEDGCVSCRYELHEAAVKIWTVKGFVRTTNQVINDYPWKKWVDPDVVDN